MVRCTTELKSPNTKPRGQPARTTVRGTKYFNNITKFKSRNNKPRGKPARTGTTVPGTYKYTTETKISTSTTHTNRRLNLYCKTCGTLKTELTSRNRKPRGQPARTTLSGTEYSNNTGNTVL